MTGRTPAQWLAREQSIATATWRAKLDRVTIRVPPEAQTLADTLHTALAHILVTRDGPATAARDTRLRALVDPRRRDDRGGAAAPRPRRRGAADYLRWYAPHQFANGKVPCCIDARGADPVPENDSPGELIFLARRTTAIRRSRAARRDVAARRRGGALHRDVAAQRAHAGVPAPRARCVLRPAAGSRSATRATPRSRCTRTGTTSGR